MLSFVFSVSSVQTYFANKITTSINKQYGTDINIEKVDLSSIRNVELKNILINDHYSDSLIYVQNLSTSILNYPKIFYNNFDLGDVKLQNGFLKMKTYKDEDTNNLTYFFHSFKKDSTKTSSTFKLSSSSVILENIDYVLYDENKQEAPIVFYKNINGLFDNFNMEGSTIKAAIQDLSTFQNNNITINKFDTDFMYSETEMQFLNTALETENSLISADIIFKYNKDDLSDFKEKVLIDANFKQADIALVDLNNLYGEFGKYDKFHFSTHAKGTLNDFVLHDVDLVSDRGSSLKGTIKMNEVFDKNNFYLKAKLENITSSYDQLKNLLPNLLGNKLPVSVQKFGQFSSSGIITLDRNNIETKLKSNSKLGSFDSELKLSNIEDIENARYIGKIELTDFKLGEFVKDSLIGELSMTGEIDGSGFTLDLINTIIEGNITKHQYKGYTYSNINVNGIIKNRIFDGQFTVDDPNIKMSFFGLADISKEINEFDFIANVAYANFNKLNLYTKDDKAVLKGIIDIDVKGNSFDNLLGEISFKDASYSNQNDNYYFKDFNVTAKNLDSTRVFAINSTDIVTGKISGNYNYKDLLKIVKNAGGSIYTNYQKENVKAGQQLEFNFNIYNKIIEVFYPEVKVGSNTFVRGKIDADKDEMELLLKSPKIEAYNNVVDNIKLQINNKNPLYNTLLSLDKIETKFYTASNFNLVNVTLNDTLFVRTDFDGGKDLTEKFELSFYHTINKDNQSVIGIKRSEINFKETDWEINPLNNNQNKFVFDDNYETFAIDNINMISGNQRVDLAGVVHGKNNKNIDLKLENVNLNGITPVIDSVYIDGKVNGTINLQSLNNKTLPYADLTVNYFSINDDYYGDFSLKATGDETIKNYNFEAQLLNNDLRSFYTSGNINFNNTEPLIDANIIFNKFNLSAFSPLGKGVLTKIRGLTTGNATVTGKFKNPDIKGELFLDNAGIALPYLNVNYDFNDNSKVLLYNQTFDFQPMTITDTEMQTQGVISGIIRHDQFKKWVLDLQILTDNLMVLNTEDEEDALYYGTGLIKGNTTLIGPTDNLIINVEGTTNPGTEFIIPLSYVSTMGESRIIHFVDPNQGEIGKENNNEIVFEELKGLTLNFNLNVTKDAVAEVVIDKLTGSVLRGSGDGNLRLNIDMYGNFNMYGGLVIDNGEYQFKNIINKDFEVQKGGTIVWNGSPFDAELNLEAINRTKANPAVLLDEITSTRKIDVNLITYITGTLSEAKFEFDIEMPNSSSLVSTELEFKLSNEDEKLTQFISLLATGSFINLEQSKANFSGNAAIAGTLAEQASAILSNVLKSSNDAIQVGVSYESGVQNKVEDVITDDQLGILVSGRIGNKVIVKGKVGVPVGSNTTTNVVGEVEVIVPLNEPETLQAKVYNRQNEIQFDIVDSEGYTQGVGISYLMEFEDNKEFLEKIGLKKTEEEKLLTKYQRDSIKKVKKMQKYEKKISKKQSKIDEN
ncbi:MAG: translocation/assembly module TamB domain-containing protein [Bacteroidota bacterium]